MTSATAPPPRDGYGLGVAPRTVDAASKAILDAAGELLASEGIEALTVRRIAAAAGGSTMNVYSRFGGKDGVIEGLLIDGFRRLGDAMESTRTTSSPLADLRRCAEKYREFALANPTHYDLMFGSKKFEQPQTPALGAVAARALNMLADRLERAMDAGLLQRRDPLLTAQMVWSACHGPVSLEMRGVGPPGTGWQEVQRQLIAALLNGLKANK